MKRLKQVIRRWIFIADVKNSGGLIFMGYQKRLVMRHEARGGEHFLHGWREEMAHKMKAGGRLIPTGKYHYNPNIMNSTGFTKHEIFNFKA